MSNKLAAVLMLVVCLSLGEAHDWGSGRCPRSSSFYKRNFDMDKFLGKWYIVKKSDTSSRCWTLTFNRKADGDLEVVESSVPAVVSLFGSKKTYISHGDLQVPNWEQSAKMRVKFSRNIIGTADYTIVDTDYTNWALAFMCQDKGFLGVYFKRQSAFLLVRDLSYDTSSIHADVRKFLSKIDVDTDLSTVKHEGCPSNHNIKKGPPAGGTLPPSVENFTEDLRVPEEPMGVIGRRTPVIITKPRRNDDDAEWF